MGSNIVPEIAMLPGYYTLLGALISGVFGWLVARHTAHSSEKVAADAQAEYDREARGVDLSARLKVLMDSYELRVRDLTAEVEALRQRIEHLSEQLEAHALACEGCPNAPTRRRYAPAT